MKRKLVARPRAKLDVIGHNVYLSERNPSVARRFRESVEATFSAIEQAPLSGATFYVANKPELQLRFMKPKGFKNYQVIYQVTDDSTVILRVLHAAQDVESSLRP